jgi:hypothetical protein
MGYKVGEIVEITKNISGHGFYIGEPVIVRYTYKGNIETCMCLDKHDWFFVENSEVKKIIWE